MKQRLSYKRLYRYRYIVVFICVVLVFAAYWQFIAYPANNKATQKAKQPAELLRTQLTQNLIYLDSVSLIETDSPASAEQHKTLSAALEQNIKEIEDSLASASKELKPEITNALAAEKDEFKIYSTNSEGLYKMLSYNPSEDVGLLDPNTQKDELQKRATATSQAVGAILGKTLPEKEPSIAPGKIKLSETSRVSLEKTKNCFETLGNTLIGSSVCVKIYENARQTLNENLIERLSTKKINGVKDGFQKIITSLSNS